MSLLLVKDKDINHIHKRLKSFGKNIKFTVFTFPNGNVHFLDIKVNENHTATYYKDSHTGQYTSFHCQLPKLHELKHYLLVLIKSTIVNKIFNNKLAILKRLFRGRHTQKLYPILLSLFYRLKSNVNRNIISTTTKAMEKLF